MKTNFFLKIILCLLYMNLFISNGYGITVSSKVKEIESISKVATFKGEESELLTKISELDINTLKNISEIKLKTILGKKINEEEIKIFVEKLLYMTETKTIKFENKNNTSDTEEESDWLSDYEIKDSINNDTTNNNKTEDDNEGWGFPDDNLEDLNKKEHYINLILTLHQFSKNVEIYINNLVSGNLEDTTSELLKNPVIAGVILGFKDMAYLTYASQSTDELEYNPYPIINFIKETFKIEIKTDDNLFYYFYNNSKCLKKIKDYNNNNTNPENILKELLKLINDSIKSNNDSEYDSEYDSEDNSEDDSEDEEDATDMDEAKKCILRGLLFGYDIDSIKNFLPRLEKEVGKLNNDNFDTIEIKNPLTIKSNFFQDEKKYEQCYWRWLTKNNEDNLAEKKRDAYNCMFEILRRKHPSLFDRIEKISFEITNNNILKDNHDIVISLENFKNLFKNIDKDSIELDKKLLKYIALSEQYGKQVSVLKSNTKEDIEFINNLTNNRLIGTYICKSFKFVNIQNPNDNAKEDLTNNTNKKLDLITINGIETETVLISA